VLLASHDYFGPGCPRNHEAEESLTSVYRSEDEGVTWQNVTHIMNCYWSSLFLHQGSVYILGVSQQYGSIVIRRSDDGGFTWTHPAEEQHGLLFRGGTYHNPPNYHCAPVPVVVHGGRVWRAFEDLNPAEWGRGFQACVISAPVEADLLDAANWTMTNKLPFCTDWIPAEWGELKNPGWLEGNVVVTPDGELWNLLRFNSDPLVDKAAIVRISRDGRQLSFEPRDFIEFPGGNTKFTIRRDPVTGLYLSLVNEHTDSTMPSQRNILSLTCSEDLRYWRLVSRLMEDDTGLSSADSFRLTGFQYVDWQFDSNDIIYLVRAAYRGAVRYHDANRIVYRVLRNYTRLIT